MATERNKKHLYFDQQEPLGEPDDPAHSKVTQDQFSRNPPTAEDNYFHEEDERKLHPVMPSEPASQPAGPSKPLTLFERLYRAIARTFDSDWRP